MRNRTRDYGDGDKGAADEFRWHKEKSANASVFIGVHEIISISDDEQIKA